MNHPYFAETREIIMKEQTQGYTMTFSNEFDRLKSNLLEEVLDVETHLLNKNSTLIEEQNWEGLQTNAQHLSVCGARLCHNLVYQNHERED